MNVQLRWNKAAISWQIRQGTFCHKPHSCVRIREILPSDYLKNTHKQPHVRKHRVSLFLISPMAPWHFGELEMTDLFFPVQTAEFELSNSLTENIKRYHSRIIVRFSFPHNLAAGREKFSANIINFMMQLETSQRKGVHNQTEGCKHHFSLNKWFSE